MQTSSDLIFVDIDRSQDDMFHRARSVRSTGTDRVCSEDEYKYTQDLRTSLAHGAIDNGNTSHTDGCLCLHQLNEGTKNDLESSS